MDSGREHKPSCTICGGNHYTDLSGTRECRDYLVGQLKFTKGRIQDLTDKIITLRGALVFYAQTCTYTTSSQFMDKEALIAAERDRGERAREALKETRE